MNNFIFNKLFSSKKIYLFLIAAIGVGVILMLFSDNKEPDNNIEHYNIPQNVNNNDENSLNSLEKKLESILSSADGVGKTKVMIKYSASPEKIPLTDKSNSSVKVIQNGSYGEKEPFITKEICAEIEGIIIVAQGGDNEKIKTSISTAVSEMLGIPIHKVNILKMSNGG